VVSTQLKNMSQNGNLPQIWVKIKKIETTTQSFDPTSSTIIDHPLCNPHVIHH